MRRHFPCTALVLGLSIFHALALGQGKSGWQAAVDAFDAKGARLLLPVHQLLLSELETAARQAQAAGDAKRRAELEATVATARRDHTKLKDGRVPHADLAEAQRDAFLRAANGVQWALAGTRNLKRIGVTMGALHIFSEDGRDLGELSGQHVLPGVFANRRNEGDGWSFYLISPALDLAHCVVTKEFPEGRVTEWRILPPSTQQALPSPPPDIKLEAAPKGQQEELHVLLKRKYHQQLLDHEGRLIRLLEDRLAEATDDDKGDLELRLMQARVALTMSQKGELAHPPPESAGAFHARLKGCTWIPIIRSPPQLRVVNEKVQMLDVEGTIVDTMPAETLWPGVLRTRAPDGTFIMLAFSHDLSRLITFPARSQFPARRVE